MSHRYIFTSILLIAALIGGCSGDEDAPPQPGTMSLSWKISPLGCEASGVENVEVEVYRKTGEVPSRYLAACTAGRTTIDGLEPGRYLINVLGLDLDGKAIFETGEHEVPVYAGEIATPEQFRLTAKKAELIFSWAFDNGRLCAANGVSDVVVGVYDMDGFAIDEVAYACADGVGTVDGIPSGAFIIEAVGMAVDGSGLYRSLLEVAVERGDELNVDLQLQACAEGC